MDSTGADAVRWRPCLAGVVALLLLACASKEPVLYPNERLRQVDPEVAREDVRHCVEIAKQQAASTPAADAARSTAEGAAVGAATGAAVGAVTGPVGRGAGAGAAGGAAHSFMRWLFRRRDPDPAVKRYAEVCLQELGYQPVGWR